MVVWIIPQEDWWEPRRVADSERVAVKWDADFCKLPDGHRCNRGKAWRAAWSSSVRRAAFSKSQESKLLNKNLLMLKSEGSGSKLKVWTGRAGIAAVCLLITFLSFTPAARAQGTSEFTLSATSLQPQAIAPGGTSSSSITIGSVNGFGGTVNLSCQVTANQTTVNSPPVCAVSPTSVTVPATATATITSTVQTTTVGYNVTITGTGPTTTYTTPPLGLTVLAVTPQFTITVQSAMSPSSVPAGSGAEGIVTVNPINGYLSPTGGGITLSCSSITPLVTLAPVCQFAYPNGKNLVVSNSPESATLTITTFGPTVTGSAAHRRQFYALWLPIPLLGLMGVGAAVGGKRSRKAWGLLAMFVVAGSIFLLPACTNYSNGVVTTPNGVTPANTYTFSIIGIDSNGVVSSNTGTGNTGPSVSLMVTAPPKP